MQPGPPGAPSLVAMAAGLVALVGTGPSPAETRAAASDPLRWVQAHGPEAAVVALAAAAAWIALGWLLTATALVAIAQRRDAVGRAADIAARVAVPHSVRLTLEAALGAAVVLTIPSPVAAGPPATPPPATSGVGATTGADLGEAGPFERAAVPPPAGPTPAPREPRSSTSAPTPASAGRSADPAVVVVAPGDSLWSIAARRLPDHATTREVATAWPRWYAANSDVIGSDPDLIHPGQRLHPPAG